MIRRTTVGLVRRGRSRFGAEGGFGLIELLIALTVTMVALMALVASLSASHVALVRSSRITTSAAIASAQLERYRALRYAEIRLDTASVAATDTTYTTDTAYDPDVADRVTGSCGSPTPEGCMPIRTVTGADGRSYRVDTYIVFEIPPVAAGVAGRKIKRVTVVVRDASGVRIRQNTAFDEATGS